MSEAERRIHPTAVIEQGVRIGNNVLIEPYVVIKSSVVIEDDVTIKAGSYIDGNTTIGSGTTIWPSVCIGTKTQDLKFAGEETYVHIGKNCEIREFVTINSSCQDGSKVVVGDGCLIMACCHIAHNCELGDNVIMSNNTVLAGHVVIESHANIGGMTAIHQFVRIGGYAMVGGMSRVTHDIPPYTVGGGIPYKFGGINRVKLIRHKFPIEVRHELSKAFKIMYRSGLHFEDAMKMIENDLEQFDEINHWLSFCRNSKRGLLGLQGVVHNVDPDIDYSNAADGDDALQNVDAAMK